MFARLLRRLSRRPPPPEPWVVEFVEGLRKLSEGGAGVTVAHGRGKLATFERGRIREGG